MSTPTDPTQAGPTHPSSAPGLATGPAAPTPASHPADPYTPDTPERLLRARGAGQAAAWCLGLLCAHLVLWETAIAPLPGGTGALALKALPLMLCLPGLWQQRLYTFRALCLLLWLYVMEALVRGPTERGLSAACAWIELILCLVLFVLAVRHIRIRVPKRPKGSQAASA